MNIMLSSHGRTLELFPYFYHSTPFINDDDDKIFTWCLKQFGEISIIGNSDTGIWCTTFRGFYFKDEQDYMLCILRWS
jgi:hypothetical protein